MGPVGAAVAEGLFAPLPASQIDSAAAQETSGMAVIRHRDVAIDPAYLASRIAPVGIDNVAGRLAFVPPAAGVRIELFSGIAVDLSRTSVGEAYGGGFVWTGEGGSNDTADLVIRNGQVTGVVSFAARTYRIDPLGIGNAHRISEIDQGQFPGDIQMPINVPLPSLPPKADRGQAISEVTVLIPYTARARDAVSDIVAQANLAVSLANTGFTRSNVQMSFRLVGTLLVNGVDELAGGVTFNSVLSDLTNGTTSGPYQPVHALRNAAGADLVAMLINKSDLCGIGWKPNAPSPSSAMYGMSVTMYSCITNHTVAHETGHNMGLNHDRYVEPAAPPSQYNFGYVSVAGQFRDIMAYVDQCTAQGFSCPKINNFSNPNVFHNGHPTGVPAGTEGAADGARWLNEVGPAVAAYRADPVQQAAIVAAVAPVARAAAVGAPVTAFATIINSSNAAATGCSIAVPAGNPVTFTYRTRATGGALGPVNTPVDIAAGGRQDFLMAFTPTAAMQANIALVFDCTNTAEAPSVRGLNTFLLTAAATAPADLISTAATVTNDGIMNIPLGQTGAAALAAINIGTAATLEARLDANAIGGAGATLPATLTMCQTDAQAQCLAAPAGTVTFQAAAGQVVTFSAFALSNGTPIAFDPANKRMFVHFFQGNTPVGSASVAVRTTTANEGALASAQAR